MFKIRAVRLDAKKTPAAKRILARSAGSSDENRVAIANEIPGGSSKENRVGVNETGIGEDDDEEL